MSAYYKWVQAPSECRSQVSADPKWVQVPSECRSQVSADPKWVQVPSECRSQVSADHKWVQVFLSFQIRNCPLNCTLEWSQAMKTRGWGSICQKCCLEWEQTEEHQSSPVLVEFETFGMYCLRAILNLAGWSISEPQPTIIKAGAQIKSVCGYSDHRVLLVQQNT